MTARDDLFELGTEYPHTLPADTLNELLGDLENEVRTAYGATIATHIDGTADKIPALQDRFGAFTTPESVQAFLRDLAEALRNLQPGQPADFFQPKRTYRIAGERGPRWTFICATVTTHPNTGQRVAVGWSRFGSHQSATWVLGQIEEDVWADGGWTDITDTETP